jgi:hypothetical protein
MSNEDRTVAAIVFGIVFVIAIKVTQVALAYLVPNLSNQYVVAVISGVFAALIAIAVTRKVFPKMFQ